MKAKGWDAPLWWWRGGIKKRVGGVNIRGYPTHIFAAVFYQCLRNDGNGFLASFRLLSSSRYLSLHPFGHAYHIFFSFVSPGSGFGSHVIKHSLHLTVSGAYLSTIVLAILILLRIYLFRSKGFLSYYSLTGYRYRTRKHFGCCKKNA
jgi:hypothetical protein